MPDKINFESLRQTIKQKGRLDSWINSYHVHELQEILLGVGFPDDSQVAYDQWYRQRIDELWSKIETWHREYLQLQQLSGVKKLFYAAAEDLLTQLNDQNSPLNEPEDIPDYDAMLLEDDDDEI